MDLVTIILRIIHIFSGVFWVGGAWTVVFFLEPTSRALVPEGGKVLGYLMGTRRLAVYLSVAALLTVLAGLILFFWHYGLAGLNTRPGLVFGIGGVFGIIALAIGGGVTGPTSSKLTQLGGEIARGGKPPTPEQGAQLAALQARMRTGARWAAAFASLALLMMASARYV